jgi:methylenetetrahydrofolate dehydrogenase (NADP+)/methenyltetrahydrofolate cyclohydrolase
MRLNATVIDGTAVARQILADTAQRAEQFECSIGRKPRLATVLVGDDPASHTYVRMKTTRCAATGLEAESHHLPGKTDTAEAVALVDGMAMIARDGATRTTLYTIIDNAMAAWDGLTTVDR